MFFSELFKKKNKKNENEIEVSGNRRDIKTDRQSKVLSDLKIVLSREPSALAKIFAPHRGDIGGYRRLVSILPHLNFDKRVLPKYILRTLNKDDSNLSTEEFNFWLENFETRMSIFSADLDIPNTNDDHYLDTNRLVCLSNLDLIYLRKHIDDQNFNSLIMHILPVSRLKKIFDNNEGFIKFDIPDEALSEILPLYISSLDSLKSHVDKKIVSPLKRDFFHDILDSDCREYLATILNDKSSFELAQIMIELKGGYRLKFMKLLEFGVQKKVIELTSGNEIYLKDADFLSRFIREIEKDYFKGDFKISATAFTP